VKQNAKYILYGSLLFAIFLTPSFILDLQDHELEAAISQAITLDQILTKRENYFAGTKLRSGDRLVNILIVPGHDDESTGAGYKGLREVDLNRELAQNLYTYLSKESGMNVVLASDNRGYSPIFKKYFVRDKKKIETFIIKSKKSFSRKMRNEEVGLGDTTAHNTATNDVVFKLYGINRWASTQKFDLVIHVHFNDYPGRAWNKPGDEVGFSIYTPGKFLENHEISKQFADSIFKELKKVRPVSTLETEKDGVIENHQLIALGSNQTLTAGSVLIEYGYIYEEIFSDPEYRSIAFDTLAYSTYSGIKKLLNEKPIEKKYEIISVTENKTTPNNLKWQYQKALAGMYPPLNKSLIDCPATGYFGECSRGVGK